MKPHPHYIRFDYGIIRQEGEFTIMSTKVLKRSEIPVELTWDLSSIFASDAEWEATFEKVTASLHDVASLRGTLATSVESLYHAIKVQENIGYDLGFLYVYAHLCFDTDTTNSHYQGYFSKIQSLYANFMAAFSFFKTELLAADEAIIRCFLEDESLKIYTHDFNQLFANRAYILSDKEETLLAQASEVFGAPSSIFGMLNNADIKFRDVTNEHGEKVPLSHGRYVLYLENKNRDVRKDAFMAMYETFKGLKNTLATTLSTAIKVHNFNAKVRGYNSARHAALSSNHIPESVYDALIEAVNHKLEYLHQYVDLRKKALKQDEVAMYDMYTPLVDSVETKFTYDFAKDIILKALSILGEEYTQVLHMAFNERWIDVLENEGKRSGAYSSGTYGTNPYILMNWQDNIDNVFTLAHELGHSVHSYFTRKTQPMVYGDYSIFLAEVASTTNEILLTDYMLAHFDDPTLKSYLINHYLDGFKGTVFRQTQFAEFEHAIHQADQQQQPLTQEFLTQTYFALNKKYYGDAMTYDEEIGFEWSRIPHFYYNYYVFQYATGFSAASALAARILSNPQDNVPPYITYLKAGSSDFPIEVLKKAGVDMTTNQATQEAIEVFKQRLEQLAALV